MIEFKHIIGDNRQIPILFLHGWGGGIESFLSLAGKLCGENKPSGILVDFKSIEDKKVLTILDYMDELNFLCEKLKYEFGYKKFNIAAHSFGARVATVYADFYKGSVNKMVLCGAAGVKAKFSLKKFIRKSCYKIAKFLVKLKFIKAETLNNYGSSDYKKLSSIMKQTFNNILKFDCRQHYKFITAETVLVFGRLDKETPIYMARIMNREVKNSRLEVFEHSGHFLYLDEPQRFKLLCENFFLE